MKHNDKRETDPVNGSMASYVLIQESETIINYILPQYHRVIDMIHKKSGKKFLMHNCGNIFPIMDAIIDTGIDAKYSN